MKVKNKIFKLGCFLAILLSGQAYSASSGTMQCYVDTIAYDYYTDNSCDNSGTPRTTAASFRLTNTTKTISSVAWTGPGASDCSTTTCNVPIRQYKAITVCADKIYYTDFTWVDVNICASAYYESIN